MPQTLADRVAQLRREKAADERRDISRKEVAREIGVSNPVISETESGTTYPSPATLAKLAHYFGVSERFLEYGDGDTKSSRPAVEVASRTGLAVEPEGPIAEAADAKKATAKGSGRKRDGKGA